MFWVWATFFPPSALQTLKINFFTHQFSQVKLFPLKHICLQLDQEFTLMSVHKNGLVPRVSELKLLWLILEEKVTDAQHFRECSHFNWNPSCEFQNSKGLFCLVLLLLIRDRFEKTSGWMKRKCNYIIVLPCKILYMLFYVVKSTNKDEGEKQGNTFYKFK